MFRPAALLIVLALAVTPVAGIVCGLNCQSQASAPSKDRPACHTHTASSHGAAIGGVHVCDHDVNAGPFVVEGQEPLTRAAAAQAVAGSPSMATDTVLVGAPVFPTSPPGVIASPNSSPLTVLRI